MLRDETLVALCASASTMMSQPRKVSGGLGGQLFLQSFRPAASRRQYVGELRGLGIDRIMRGGDACFPAIIPLQARDRKHHRVQGYQPLSQEQGFQPCEDCGRSGVGHRAAIGAAIGGFQAQGSRCGQRSWPANALQAVPSGREIDRTHLIGRSSPALLASASAMLFR
jgi:hypothetical protein